MTDDLDRLRGVMTDTAEHGGSTDLYERALHESRRLRRRSVATRGVAAATGVLAIVASATLVSGRISGPPAPPATDPPTVVPIPPPSTEPTSASPTPSASSPPPSGSTSPARPSRTTASGRPDHGCPVTAATLNRVPGLPDGYRISPDRVDCWKDWATGWDPKQQGDGLYLFRYTPSRGWRIHGEGSAFNCADLGITRDPDDPPPFCY